MNMCMVDVTDIPGAALEDEVVLLGRQGDEAITHPGFRSAGIVWFSSLDAGH